MRFVSLTVLLLGVAACGRDQTKAEEALERADRFFSAMETEAAKVFPETVKVIGDSLKLANDEFAAGDYQDARNTAIGVANEAVRVAKLVPGKRQELDSVYKMVSIEITHPVRQVVGKIRQFNASGGVPRGMTRTAFDSLKKDVTTWEDSWNGAVEEYQKGELGLAASKATALKTSVVEAMKLLRISQ